jgi:hypothetical protein
MVSVDDIYTVKGGARKRNENWVRFELCGEL